MNVLVIDNNSSYIDALVSFIDTTIGTPTVLPLFDFDLAAKDDYDLTILSGGNQDAVLFDAGRYNKEIELIQTTEKPLIGICLGFELIIKAYGGSLVMLDNKVHGEINIQIDPPIDGENSFLVFSSHRWVAKSLPESLIPLGYSKNGIEILRHKVKDIYGFQFHPEMSKNTFVKELFLSIAKNSS